MLAIIKTGGKQYIVKPGDKIKIEKIEMEAGKEVVFPEILLTEKNGKIEVGTPLVKNVNVVGEVVKQGKNDKVITFKYKAKKRTSVKKGHRQPYTEIDIKSIS